MLLKNKDVELLLEETCLRTFGCSVRDASSQQIYKSLCIVVRDILAKKRKSFQDDFIAKEQKQVYYMSMEFLVGPSLRNNLFNLGAEEVFKNVLDDFGVNIEDMYAQDPDAGLGNGGLGRLASCYMDSMTTQGIPASGFSIRYEFGIFKQKIVDGWQMEFPDDWLGMGDVWLLPRNEEYVDVKFGGTVTEWFDGERLKIDHKDYNVVRAIPYDMFISGYNTPAVNKLVLWSAKSPDRIDMGAFSRGDYAKALEKDTMAEVISKVLYPADDHIDGKRLRLQQQYLLVSASLQSIINQHVLRYGTPDTLPEKVSIQINDTHPALCVPELMRILLDEYGYGWDDAWKITENTLSYTNHTVMSEALEKWSVHLFSEQMPRVYQIVCEINRRLLIELNNFYPGDTLKIDYMSVISKGEIKMANLCLAACHKVNGVSKLHTDILKNTVFKDYYTIYPDKFTNITNGIAYRRWLCQANPQLTKLIKNLIGSDFMNDCTHLSKLLDYYDEPSTLSELERIKFNNKVILADYISKTSGIIVDPNSLFDVQIKRLHEYKRQLLNVLHIIYMYRKIKENPNTDITPRTFIFAAKASAGYFMAKQIIRLIVALSNVINSDPVAREFIKVVFIEDYKVSLAEIIIPAAEISEQISIAGKEASGTGNMKLMINGAVTIGTLDGANVEIHEQVGDENMFLFGLRAHEAENLWKNGYDPLIYCRKSHELNDILEMLSSDVFGASFDDIVKSLTTNKFGTADAFMTLADFDDYARVQDMVSQAYKDKRRFSNMSLVNIAKAGVFSSDRAINEYAERVWHI